MSLRVVRPGAFSLVVDAGRERMRHLGFASCGPFDRRAYDGANAALANDPRAAALEIVFGNATFAFEAATAFVLTGADTAAALDGVSVPVGQVTYAAPEATLVLRAPERGARTILAVAGGFTVSPILGSRTTDRAGGFGGFCGRALRAEDRLPFLPLEAPRAWPSTMQQSVATVDIVRAMPGPEWMRFSAESRERFWNQPWVMNHQSDRTGVRLEGEPLACELGEIAARATLPGFVQVPPAGEPIVFGPDAPVTGSYPVIAVVEPDDISIFAQLRPGESIRFQEARA